MIISWWRNLRRRRILRDPFPAEWDEILRRNCPPAAELSAEDQQRLRELVQIFIAEKYWEGCNGLTLTDEMQVTIAAHACRLLLGFRDKHFDRLQTVLVYPDRYVAREQNQLPGGVVSESLGIRLGEAWTGGPVILSWASILEDIAGENPGHNVVLHEFAHVLDMEDFGADGTPPLHSAHQYETWRAVMTAEFERLQKRIQRGQITFLDAYGATDAAEFFAVVTESFFERAEELQAHHPELYDIIRDFYQQDPANRNRPAE